MALPTPPRIPQPFATDADNPAFLTLPIPNTASGGLASWEMGFPSDTMTPEIAGGVPPRGQDFNGIFYTLSAHNFWVQAGMPYKYNVDVRDSIGGYQLGAVLGMSDTSGLWLNQVVNNTNNPDTNGGGWVPIISYGPGVVTTLTGGTFTLTVDQWKHKLITVQGALVANQTLIVPAIYQDWLFVNQCTGNFTLTVRTAGGSGVVIPPGGLGAPTGVYCDSQNVYPTVAPLNLPISQGPEPGTIVQRTNGGYIIATYFNSAITPENAAVSAVYFESGSDNFIRKMTLTNFEAQLLLQNMSGAVTQAQVPQNAVTQYAAVLNDSPALTGNPTAPTAAVGDSDTTIATTAFCNPGQSAATNGYVKLPGGMIMQWGQVFVGNLPPGSFTDVGVTFPIAFPTACFNIQSSLADNLGLPGGVFTPGELSRSTSGATFRVRELNAGTQNITLNWFAVGA